MSRLPLLLLALFAALLAPSAAAAATPCSGAPDQVRPITLTVDGEPATGLYTLPAGRPRGLVVFAHGAANTADAWRRHLVDVARRDGVIAVAMNYRGMEVTGIHATRGTETARGFPAKKGSEDLVAAAQHFDTICRDLPGIVLYGVSMGGSVSGLAAAAGAKRSDGRPLFDYWFAIEGVHNFTESYFEARIASVYVKFAATSREDMEREAGGPFERNPSAYFQRTNVLRVDDIAASGLRGVVLVHAYEDGVVPYNQSVEMARRLRDAGVPTDFYSVGRREPGDTKHDTIGGYAGVRTGLAGHGWEGSDTHVVIQTGLDRLNAQITRGEPAPCGRDFRVDERPSNVSPDPREGGEHCRPDPFPSPREDPCTDRSRPARPSVAVRGRDDRRVVVRGRAADRGCAGLSRVMVAVDRKGRSGRCRPVTARGALGDRRSCRRPLYVRASGSERWRRPISRRLPSGRYLVRVRAVDAGGRRGRLARASFRLR